MLKMVGVLVIGASALAGAVLPARADIKPLPGCYFCVVDESGNVSCVKVPCN
jgi:hypothetical protein